MTMRDLHTYAAPERAPTRIGYRGLDVYGMGPPSSGGSTVGEALNILEGYPLSTMTREAALHRFIEASRYSFADRGAYLADPAYFDVPLTGLLSDGFAATRRALITETAATSPVAPGNPYPFNGGGSSSVQASATATRVGNDDAHHDGRPLGQRRGIHVHDRVHGRRRPGRPGVRLPREQRAHRLQLRLADASEPGRGRQAAAQLDEPDDRARRTERRCSSVGSPGGSTIITTVLQILIDRLDLGLTLPQAIADPRLSQRNTATTQAEPAFLTTATAAALRARGHVFSSTPEIGAATGVEFLPGGVLLAAAEPTRRGGGSAMVVNP